ncbi:hypothetical protein B0H14DRAFT_525819 [Mycena olivaceomarginata]|nr:hypothetical protein B0H14DRAFT_525819 [Mycena olivaceomarginata]
MCMEGVTGVSSPCIRRRSEGDGGEGARHAQKNSICSSMYAAGSGGENCSAGTGGAVAAGSTIAPPSPAPAPPPRAPSPSPCPSPAPAAPMCAPAPAPPPGIDTSDDAELELRLRPCAPATGPGTVRNAACSAACGTGASAPVSPCMRMGTSPAPSGASGSAPPTPTPTSNTHGGPTSKSIPIASTSNSSFTPPPRYCYSARWSPPRPQSGAAARRRHCCSRRRRCPRYPRKKTPKDRDPGPQRRFPTAAGRSRPRRRTMARDSDAPGYASPAERERLGGRRQSMPVSPGLGLGGGKNDEVEVVEVEAEAEAEVVVPPSNEGFFWLWLFWLTLFWL